MSEISEIIERELPIGIINWYPFAANSSICFKGECSEYLKQDILSRGLRETPAADGLYDYILAVLYLERAEDPAAALWEMRKQLKPSGHLFLACENRMGLRYFAGDRDPFTDRNFDGVEGYRNFTEKDRDIFGGRCYSQNEICEFVQAAGFENYQGFSVLPGLMMPQQMYAWDCLPKEKLAIRYTPLYYSPSTVFLQEEQLYDSIIANGMFHQMANAYLIDCTVSGEFYPVESVTTSMDRGHENATATIILKDNQVVKRALYPEGNERMKALINNTEALSERGIGIVKLTENVCGEYEGEAIVGVTMPYIEAPAALEYLRDIVYKDKELFINEVDRYMKLIYKSSIVAADNNSELGDIYEQVYMDMVPLNCFYQEGEFVFFDQEFSEPMLPVSVVLMRALDILYMGDKSMEAVVPMQYFIDKYGMKEKVNAIRDVGNIYISKLRHRGDLAAYNKVHLADATYINANRQRMNYSQQEYSSVYTNALMDAKNKKIYIFGSGIWAKKFAALYGEQLDIVAFLDNNAANIGKIINGIRVAGPDELKGQDMDSIKVIVCIKYYTSILKQLKNIGVKSYGLYDPNIEINDECILPVRDYGRALECNNECAADTAGGSSLASSEQAEYKVGDVLPDGIKKYKVGYVAGVFDLFHIGHLNILKRAKAHCEYLIVGVVSDEQATANKKKSPYVNENERCEIVSACKYVDEAFVMPMAASGSREIYKRYRFDAQFSGSDYENNAYWLNEQAWLRERGSDIVFFPYTESTSSTKLKTQIENADRT